MRKIILASVFVLMTAVCAVFVTANRVVGTDMAPSILENDHIWMIPWGDPLPGDVVSLSDPLDPEKTILRRVVGIAGQSITYDEDTIRVGKRRLRKQAMGDDGDHMVSQETLWAKKPKKGHAWLTRQIAHPATHWAAEEVTIPENHVYLLADDRDSPLDSRWWGTVPVSALKGILRIRWGTEHTWRPKIEWTVGTQPIRD
jgi:signal peptidase I